MDLLEMASDLVTAQIERRAIDYTSTAFWLRTTYDTLLRLWLAEQNATVEPPGIPGDWRSSIRQTSITCLVCGKVFKQLGYGHLADHGLTSKTYRSKYGMPPGQTLSARVTTRRRRKIVQAVRPWQHATEARRRRRHG